MQELLNITFCKCGILKPVGQLLTNSHEEIALLWNRCLGLNVCSTKKKGWHLDFSRRALETMQYNPSLLTRVATYKHETAWYWSIASVEISKWLLHCLLLVNLAHWKNWNVKQQQQGNSWLIAAKAVCGGTWKVVVLLYFWKKNERFIASTNCSLESTFIF